jgi:hypothetical protein
MINLKKLSLVTLLLPYIAFAQTDYKAIVSKSWALKNTGVSQLFDLDPVQTYRLQARVGEDMHLLPPVASPVALKKIKVAVLDTGVDVNHPYLKNRIARSEKECANYNKFEACLKDEKETVDSCTEKYLATDEDGNGYPADCNGWSIFGKETPVQNIIGTPDVEDTMGHGTHVAGLVASISDQIQIIPVQVIAEAPNEPVKPFSIDLSPSETERGGLNGQGALENAERTARGIIYAMNAGADIITMSIGWPEQNDTQLLKEAVAEAQARGIIVLAAAGNDSTQSLLRPCQYPGVICVGASRPDGAMAYFSNYGYGVDLAAPGTGLVSTIPMTHRSVRLPGFIGIDILNGTSQATPLVAGVVADMLSRGIPKEEIYPRLILGARKPSPELPVLVGPIQTKGTPVLPESSYERYTLAGLVDARASMAVKAKTLILSANKEIQIISWDRKSRELSFQFAVKNYWSDVNFNDVQLDIVSKNKTRYYPTVVSSEIMNENDNMWEMGEERLVQVNLEITDAADADLSQVASDLTFLVTPTIAGAKGLVFETRAEIQTKLTKESAGSDLTSVPIVGSLAQGMKLFLVDEVYDNAVATRDYMALKQNVDASSFDLQLVRNANNAYTFEGIKTVKFPGNIKRTRPVQRIRMDIDGDGKSEYILVIQEYKEEDGLYANGDYTLHFYIMDSNLNLKKQVSFYDERAVMPTNYSWLKVGNELRPAWVLTGKPVIKKWDITDLYQTDEDAKPNMGQTDIRLYYLDKDYKLAEVQSPKDSRIVDIIQPTLKQVQTGVLPVLIAKNLGTEVKPSYLYQFSLAYIQNLKVTGEKVLENLSASQDYRNLLDTKVDRIVNLQKSSDEYRGTFWFGLDAHKKQRITAIDFTNNKMHDRLIDSKTTIYDAPLFVRSVYMGKKSQGVFLITNSEIEYHDFKGGSAAQTSLNKYTFMGNDLTVNLQFPIAITSRKSGDKYPALFNVAGTAVSRGVKMITPVYDKAGKVEQILAPARLHIQTPQGCRPQDAPVYLGADGYALDYYCGDRFLRLKLTY